MMNDFGYYKSIIENLEKVNATQEEIRDVFGGKNDITAEFFVEWTE